MRSDIAFHGIRPSVVHMEIEAPFPFLSLNVMFLHHEKHLTAFDREMGEMQQLFYLKSASRTIAALDSFLSNFFVCVYCL